MSHYGRVRNRPRSGRPCAFVAAAIAALIAPAFADAQELPEPIQAPGEFALLTVHAEGAQIYQCTSDATGKLAWIFREPIATLLRDGKTVGRHYAGPRWELTDGGGVQGKVEAKAPGATTADIPWLKLSASGHFGQGALGEATTIQRINTRGGALDGHCDAVGTFRSVAYSADYVFLKK
jgi:hypothetical protein